MHEAALAQSILKAAGEAAGRRAPCVRAVVVTVGELAGVMPGALEFAFDAVKASFGMDNARLKLEKGPVAARCTECGSEYTPGGYPFTCPVCGSTAFRIAHGEEVFVKELEVEEL